MRIRDFDAPVMDKVYDAPVVLDERYIGETPGVKHVFELFCKFRDKYRDKASAWFRKSFSVSGDPDLKVFCEACAELWGFESCSMVINQADIVQFMTFSIGGRVDLPTDKESMVEYGPNGVRFKAKYHVHLFTIGFTGLLFNFNYTNREAFAIFLHEVGHNFQEATNGVMNSLSNINKYVIYLSIMYDLIMDPKIGLKEVLIELYSSNGILGILGGAYNSIVSTKAGKLLVNTFGVFSGILTDAFYAGVFMANKLVNADALRTIIRAGLKKLIFPTIFVHRYAGEQMADSFAADLGFGPDSASADLKLEKIGQDLDFFGKVPIVNAILDLWCLPFNMLVTAFDEHPTTGARIKGLVDIMKSDLSKGYCDPKAKKALEKDIKATEKAVADFQTNMAKHPFEYNKIFSAAVMCVLFNGNGGLKYNTIKINHSEEKQKAFERNQNQATGNVVKI